MIHIMDCPHSNKVDKAECPVSFALAKNVLATSVHKQEKLHNAPTV